MSTAVGISSAAIGQRIQLLEDQRHADVIAGFALRHVQQMQHVRREELVDVLLGFLHETAEHATPQRHRSPLPARGLAPRVGCIALLAGRVRALREREPRRRDRRARRARVATTRSRKASPAATASARSAASRSRAPALRRKSMASSARPCAEVGLGELAATARASARARPGAGARADPESSTSPSSPPRPRA